jgi:hypothetical protein
MQLPDIIKSNRVLVIKIKKEWKEKAGEGKTENRDRDKKERMVFKMEVWEDRCDFAG